MNIQLSKITLNLLADCTRLQDKLEAIVDLPVELQNAREYHLLFEQLSSQARIMAMSLQADKEMTK
jgi:hypothetical protein